MPSEKATIPSMKRTIPDWLREKFQEEMEAAKRIDDPVKRRLAIIDVDMREAKIMDEFREAGNDA